MTRDNIKATGTLAVFLAVAAIIFCAGHALAAIQSADQLIRLARNGRPFRATSPRMSARPLPLMPNVLAQHLSIWTGRASRGTRSGRANFCISCAMKPWPAGQSVRPHGEPPMTQFGWLAVVVILAMLAIFIALPDFNLVSDDEG